jgi:hypothetical protein
MAMRGRVASFALVGWEIGSRLPNARHGIDIVMLIGASIRREV